MINATDILTTLAEEVAPHLGSTVLDEVRILEAMPVKIEFKGVVDDLVVKSIYFVPSNDEYPAALHIEVEPNDCNFARIPPDKDRPPGSLCQHKTWNNNGRCAEMMCWNYVEKHHDDPIPFQQGHDDRTPEAPQGHRHGDHSHDHLDGHQRHDHDSL